MREGARGCEKVREGARSEAQPSWSLAPRTLHVRGLRQHQQRGRADAAESVEAKMKQMHQGLHGNTPRGREGHLKSKNKTAGFSAALFYGLMSVASVFLNKVP